MNKTKKIICPLIVIMLLAGCTNGQINSESDNQDISSNSKDNVIASGNGIGGNKNDYEEISDDITTFAHIDKEEAPDGTPIVSNDNYNIEDCIDLPDLHSMTVVCPITMITEEEAERCIRNNSTSQQLWGDDVTIKKWDIVTIDYTTSCQGNPMEETGTGTIVSVGSATLPTDIETSLIGHHLDDEYSVDVNYPDSYTINSDYTGKTITYNIKVLLISRTPDPSSDEIASKQAELQKDIDSSAVYNKYEAIAKYLIDNSNFKAYPRTYVEEARYAYELNAFGDFGTVAKYAEENQLDVKTIKAQEDAWIISVIKRKVVTEAVANSLGVTKECEEYKEKQSEAKFTDNENENLLYTALDKIINETEYMEF